MRMKQPASLFTMGKTAFLLVLCLCLVTAGALADGVMPQMPAPPSTPVYWQLTSIEQTPEVTPGVGYSVHYDLSGLSLDLEDGLLTESQLSGDDAAQGLHLIIEKNDQVVMEHSYIWSPLPIYIEPNTDYEITITGHKTVGGGTAPNSILYIYEQGNFVDRISAGEYSANKTTTTFQVTSSVNPYVDGTLVVSFVLRDVNEMFRNRLVFTYTMHDGLKPEPTPIPGFAPVDMPEDLEIPEFYVPVEGADGLYTILTAPEQYRAYGSMSGSEPAFFPADAEGEVLMNQRPATEAADFEQHVQGFVAESPDALPDFYTVTDGAIYQFTTRDGDTLSRVYGRIDGNEPAYYEPAEDGTVDAEAAQPIDPENDYTDFVEGFGAAILEESLPKHYIKVEDGLYSFTDRDGQTHFRIYGRYNGSEPQFYPAEESGAIAENAEAVEPEEDFVAHIKGFTATTPEEVPYYYEPISDSVYAIKDHDDVAYHRVYGVKDGNEPAYYPADSEGNLESEDAEAIDPAADFEQYVSGFMPLEAENPPAYYEKTEVPGVWAFIDKDSESQYRAYGSLHRAEPAFYPSDAAGNVNDDALPVNPSSDLTLMPVPDFTPLKPESIPSYYHLIQEDPEVYGYSDLDEEDQLRVYGSYYGKDSAGFYPATKDGEPIDGTMPLETEAEYQEAFASFEPAEPETIPAHYSKVEGKQNLYRFIGPDGRVYFRVYGSVTKNGEPQSAFYPADEEGKIVSGRAVDLAREYDEAFGSFAEAAPEVAAAHYEAVPGKDGLYTFTDADGKVQFRIYGSLAEGSEPAYYPADENGTIISAEAADTSSEHASLFGTFKAVKPEAEDVPFYYIPVENKDNVYAFFGEDGKVEFRAYGEAEGGEEAGFYPSNQAGDITATEAVEPQVEYDKLYAAFTPAKPAIVPSRYAPVEATEGLYTFTDDQGEEAYRIYGEIEGAEAAYYPADAEGNIVAATPVDPQEDVRRMPMIITSSISTPVPKAEPETTPLARVKESSDSTWADPNAPQPTQYSANVVPGNTAGTEAPATVDKVITAAPDATAETQPTEYAATITSPETAASGNPTVTSIVSAAPEATATEEAVEATPEAEATEEATTEPTEEATVEPKVSETEAATATPESTPVVEEASQSNTTLWIIIAVAAVIIIGVVCFIVFGRKKK